MCDIKRLEVTLTQVEEAINHVMNEHERGCHSYALVHLEAARANIKVMIAEASR